MKSKTWVLILSLALLALTGVSLLLLLPGDEADTAEIWSDGKLIATVDLSRDQTLTIQSDNGVNVVTVRDGKIAVTEADCPDHYCMARGYCSGGMQIVCLPNRLVIKFLGQTEIDSEAG